MSKQKAYWAFAISASRFWKKHFRNQFHLLNWPINTIFSFPKKSLFLCFILIHLSRLNIIKLQINFFLNTAALSLLPTFAQPSSHKLTVHSSPLPIGLLQVQQSQEKIARLEQEKEHWLLEAQLGKVRLEKENQRIADLEAQLAAALGGSPNSLAAATSTLAQSHEEAEKEQKAAGKETTLCTSLVVSLYWLLHLLVFACGGNFLPMALVSDLLQQREHYRSFLVAPTLSKFLLNKTQTSNVLMWQKRRLLLFMQVSVHSRVTIQSSLSHWSLYCLCISFYCCYLLHV